MKTITTIFFFLLFFWFMIRETEVPDNTPETWNNPKPDSTREVHSFDWAHNRYVYKDEIKLDTVKYDWGPIKSMPDYSVRIEGGYQPPKVRITNKLKPKKKSMLDVKITEDMMWVNNPRNQLPELLIGGKRYRQRVRGDGSIQLIPIR